MKMTLPIIVTTVLALVAFPALSIASVLEPSNSSGHIFENIHVDYGMRTGLVGIVKAVDERSILIQNEGLTKGETLVITTNKNGLSPEIVKALSNRTEVHIEGRAQILSIDKLEDKNEINLNDSSLKKYEGKTIVVAETIDLK